MFKQASKYSLLPGALFAVTGVSQAQEIEGVEVLGAREHVRTELRETQDIPLSISIVGGDELDRLQARDIKSLVQRLSNVSWSAGNSRTSAISMRGIGKQAQTDAMDPSVGVVVDNVPYAYNPLASFGFFDVDAIEVTRGPQGTLSGKNANVGLINVTTKRPTFEPTTEFQVSLGQNSRIAGTVAAGGPLIDGLLAWRAAASVDKGDGDYPNRYDEDHTFLNRDKAEGRLQFLLTPADNFEGRFIFDIKPRQSEYYNGWNFYHDRPDFYANGDPVTSLGTEQRLARRWFAQVQDYNYERDYLGNSVNMDAQRPLVTKSRGASGELNWQLGSYRLTSITAWRDYDFRAGNDEGTTFDVTKNGGGYSHNEQTSQEFRVSTNVGGFVDYQAGLYFLKQETNYISGGDDHGADAGAWFANDARYGRLDADAAGRYLMLNSIWGLQTRTGQEIENKTQAAFTQAKWHLTDAFTLTTGARYTREDRTNASWRRNTKEGYAPELNPVSVNGVQLGGFNSNGAGVLGTNTPEQLALADFTANKYFGVASYAALTGAQRQQIADAKATRAGRIGVVWNGSQVGTFKDTQPSYLFSPSYRFNDNITGYASYQYGEKASIALITNGVATPARPEKNTSYEVGAKTAWLDDSLTLNLALFLTDIEDYQQAVLIFDQYTTTNTNDGRFYYTQQTGNADKVRAKGVEIDAFYSGIPHTTIRFSGAYNDAYYVKFPFAPQPVENTWNGASSYRDASGLQLPGASKYSANVGVDFQYPISLPGGAQDSELHVSLNTAYISKFNSDIALSSYAWIPGSTVTDLSLGVSWGNYDLSLIGKNIFDDDTPLSATWESTVPGVRRWLGVALSGRL